MNHVAREPNTANDNPNSRELARVIRRLSFETARLTQAGARLSQFDKDDLLVARGYIETAINTEAYWQERKGDS